MKNIQASELCQKEWVISYPILFSCPFIIFLENKIYPIHLVKHDYKNELVGTYVKDKEKQILTPFIFEKIDVLRIGLKPGENGWPDIEYE